MTQSLLVTLVDPDPKGLAILGYAFESEGFKVISSSDLGMASELVRSTGAQAAVVALRAPQAPGLHLIGEIADALGGGGAPGTAIVVLGAPESRRAALEAGASDYLDTPAFVRDAVITARLRLLSRAPAGHRNGPPEASEAPEILGSLEAVHGLYALMRAMAAAQRSGVLQLVRGNRKAEVKFTEGAVTSAQVRGLQAFPALHQLLLWNQADLTLKLRDVAKRPQFSATGTEILEECERFLRDVHHAVRQLGGSFEAVYARDARQAGAQATTVPEEVAPVARLFDGARTLGEVIEESPFRIFDTLRAIKRLIDSGVLIARVAGSGAAGAAGKAPLTAAVPRARIKSGPHPHPAPAQPAPAQPAPVRPAPVRELDAMLHDRRGVAGDRRKVVRRTPSGFAKPAAKPAPAPIPLVAKKSPSGAVASGEIRAPRVAPSTATRPVVRPPSVEVKLDPPPLSLDVRVPSGAYPVTGSSAAPAPAAVVPAAAPAPHPAPLSARQPAAPIRLKKAKTTPSTGAPGPGAPAAAFNALEADFFAREADLYKDQGPDTFDDLEHGAEPRRRPRTATPRGSKKR